MTKAAKTEQTYAEKKKAAAAKAQEDFKGLLFHSCEIVKGRKYPIGSTVECIWIGVNRYLHPMARCLDSAGNDVWINPANLKAGKAMNKAKVAALKAEQEAEREATLLVPGAVIVEKDRSIQIAYTGWFKRIWFAKSMVTKIAEDINDMHHDLFELPVWKIRNEVGDDAVEMLETKQDEFAKLAA